jgi:hypothetical protein
MRLNGADITKSLTNVDKIRQAKLLIDNLHTSEEFSEGVFQLMTSRDTLRLMEALSEDEHMQVAFVPLVITDVIWYYVDEVLEYVSTKHKIKSFSALSRAVRDCKKRYEQMIAIDLDEQHVEYNKKKAEEFRNLNYCDFQRLYWTMNGEIKKYFPDARYIELLTLTHITLLLIKVLKLHNRKMDNLLYQKLGGVRNTCTNPHILSLEILMEQYCGDYMLSYGDVLIDRCMKVIANRIKQTRFCYK